MAQRNHYLFVCLNRRPDEAPRGSCAAHGAEEILLGLKAALRDGGLAQVEARACSSSCLDVCGAGPVVAVQPDGFFYGRVQPSDVPEIVESLREGTRVERLVLQAKDFD
jgi:(2Fe-2S) ferredoxin